MNISPNLPNRLRSGFGTLAFLGLVVAAIAFGATWVIRTGLERDAVGEAGTAAGSIVQPALEPKDLESPMGGDRYGSLRDLVERRVVVPPVTSVEIWNADGTIVFANRRSRVGAQVASMRPMVHDAVVEGSLKRIEGDTFRALIGIGVGESSAVVEVDRPLSSITAQAERWRPWIPRGIRAAVLFLVLYVGAVALSIVVRRQRASLAEKLPEPVRTGNAAPAPDDSHLSVRRRKTDAADGTAADAPAYMQPGFREHLEARRDAEDALVNTQHALRAAELDRERLQQRLEHTESELQDARRRLAEHGAAAGR